MLTAMRLLALHKRREMKKAVHPRSEKLTDVERVESEFVAATMRH